MTTTREEQRDVVERLRGFDESDFYERPWSAHETMCESAEVIEELRAEITRLRASQAGGAPAGWQLVPIEPTPEMTRAGMDPFLAAHDPFYAKNEPTAPIYRAMLSASPPPPATDGALESEGLAQATVQGNGSVTLPMCQWQPIETAPKGKKVIVRATGDFQGHRTMMARFYPKHTLEAPDGYGASDGFDEDEHGDVYAPEAWYEDMEAEEPPLHNIVPTHWMPLPVAPETEGKK